MAARDRRLRIAFDADQAVVAMEDQLGAADAAVGADAPRDARFVVLAPQRAGAVADRRVLVTSQLTDERPLEKELG
jgi:hypothetical protein